MMLGGEDHLAEAVVLRDLHPLVRVDGGGGVVLQEEALGPGLSVAGGVLTVPAGESGLAVMIEHQEFLALPGDLAIRGHGAESGRSTGIGGRGFRRRRRLLHREGAGGGMPAVHGRHRDGGIAGGKGRDGTVVLVDGRDGGIVDAPGSPGVRRVRGSHLDSQPRHLAYGKFELTPKDAHTRDGDCRRFLLIFLYGSLFRARRTRSDQEESDGKRQYLFVKRMKTKYHWLLYLARQRYLISAIRATIFVARITMICLSIANDGRCRFRPDNPPVRPLRAGRRSRLFLPGW